MTPRERVGRARAALAAITSARSLLWGLAAALATYAVTGFLAGRGGAASAVCGLVGGTVTVAMLWQGRAVWSIDRTALWVEARAPQLQYALVTAIEPRAAPLDTLLEAYVQARLGPVIDQVDIGRIVFRAGARVLAWAAVGAVVGVVMVMVVPAAGRATLRIGRERPPLAGDATNRLATLVARVTPPAYTHRSPREIREPTIITSIVGSTIELDGRGASDGLRATVGTDSAAVAADGSGWRVRLTMPTHSRVLRLRDRGFERIVGLDAVPDNPPTVVLDQPARDSTLRTPHGTLVLDARAGDDIGLRDGYFELIISAGDEEGSFRSVEHRIGLVDFGDASHASLGARIDLATLGLSAGGRLSIRGVVRDDNTVSGPGIGTSETRTVRIAKAQEYDSVAVEGEPPPPLDSAYLSQRMVVARTRALRREAPRLPRDSVAHRADVLGDLEDQLRDRVQSLLNGPDEEEGGGPLVLPDWQRPLFDTALRALGDASGDLRGAKLTPALEPELVALRVMDRARAGNRLYLRGGSPTIVVNTERVRLSGHDKPDASPRTPEPPDDTAALAAVTRLETMARLAARAPSAMADSLAVLQVAVLSTWPAAAAALGDAVAAVRAQRDPHVALARARRAIVGAPSPPEGLPVWNGGGE
jgi:hypothetical protein